MGAPAGRERAGGARRANGDAPAGAAEGIAFAAALAGAMPGPSPAASRAERAAERIAEDGSTAADSDVSTEDRGAGESSTAPASSTSGVASRETDAAGAGQLAAGASAAGASAAGASAAGASAAAASAGAARPVDGVNRDRGALDPELDARLARVEARMLAAGRPISIVETGRSAERQEWLFAQGRTRPGPVVTWTQDSRHETGRAVDVTVGGPADGRGYALLQQVARAEGLFTLGMKDPGHLELREGGARAGARQPRGAEAAGLVALDASSAAAAGVSVEELVLPAPAVVAAPVATVARVARVAGVAQVATVATVAGVASAAVEAPRTRRRGAADSPLAGAASTGTNAQRLLQLAASELAGATAPASPRTTHESGVAGLVAAAAGQRGAAGDDEGEVSARQAPGIAALQGAADPSSASAPSTRQRLLSYVQRMLARPTGDDARADAGDGTAEPGAGTHLSARGEGGFSAASWAGDRGAAVQGAPGGTPAQVAQVRALREAPVPLVASLAVALDRADGAVDRVRVGVAGRRLDASIVSPDRGLTQLLQNRIPELATTLERAGLSPDRLDVVHQDRTVAESRSATVAAAANAATIATGAARDGGGTGSGHPDGRHDPRAGAYGDGEQQRDARRQSSRERGDEPRPAFASVLPDARDEQ